MKRVYKYPISNDRSFTVKMDAKAKVLKVGPQNNEWFLWALVDPDAPKIERHFYLYGTGHDIPEGKVHLATWEVGPFVIHCFENQVIN